MRGQGGSRNKGILIAAGAVVALIGVLVVGTIVPKLFRFQPWDDSPTAEMYAPSSKSDFKQACYTLVLMLLIDKETQPLIILQHGKDAIPKTLEEMVDQGIIESRMAYDAWGRPMEFDWDALTVHSPGKDGDWGTIDDLSFEFDTEAEVPDIYWGETEFIRKTEENHLVTTIYPLQAQLESESIALMQQDSMSRSR